MYAPLPSAAARAPPPGLALAAPPTPPPEEAATLPKHRVAGACVAARWYAEVTPKGVLPIAVCHASATREEPGKPKRPPRTKIM